MFPLSDLFDHDMNFRRQNCDFLRLNDKKAAKTDSETFITLYSCKPCYNKPSCGPSQRFPLVNNLKTKHRSKAQDVGDSKRDVRTTD